MTIHTDENGRIVRLEDPRAKTRINFYGKERVGKTTKTAIARLTETQVKDLCKRYYVMRVKDGKIVDATKTAKAKALKKRYGSYLKGNPDMKKKIEKKYEVSLGAA